jgi:hypothetical protein
MANRSTTVRAIGPHDVKVPPSPHPLPPGGGKRRAAPEGAERTAQELIHESGSVRKAKRAIDRAAELETGGEFREDQLALRWGFKSRQELLAASKPIRSDDGERWWATRTHDGCWLVWNQATVREAKHSTLDEARASLRADDDTATAV